MGRMKRAGALLLCVAFVLTLFVSSAYLVHEAGHTHCTEEDCPVCRTIATAVSFLRALGLVILVLSAFPRPESAVFSGRSCPERPPLLPVRWSAGKSG